MSDVNVRLVLSMVDRATAPLRGLQARIGALAGGAGFGQVAAAAKGVGSAMSGVASSAALVATRFSLLGAGLGVAFKTQLIDTAAQFERYSVVLTSLEGSAEGARKALAWVSNFAQTTPLEIDGVMEAFVRLKAFGLDPMDGTLQSLTDMNAKLGGNQEKLQGIVLAVGQAWAKQKLQGEEILQLVERGVPVWDLLNKVTGKQGEELQKLSSKGKLGRDVIKALVKEMGVWSKGAAEAQMRTWDGMMSNLSDQWLRFRLMVMDAGLFDWLKSRMTNLLATIDRMAASGELKAMATTFGASLKTGAIAAWGALKTLGNGIVWIKDLFGGWENLAIAVGVAMGAPLVKSMLDLGLAVGKLGAAITALVVANPIADFILVMGGALAMALGLWNPIEKLWPEQWDRIVNIVGGTIEQIGINFEQTLARIRGAWEAFINWFNSAPKLQVPGAPAGGVPGINPNAAPSLGPGAKPLAPLSQAAPKATVDGIVRIEVEDGRTRVRSLQSSGGIGLEAGYTGQAMAYS